MNDATYLTSELQLFIPPLPSVYGLGVTKHFMPHQKTNALSWALHCVIIEPPTILTYSFGTFVFQQHLKVGSGFVLT